MKKKELRGKTMGTLRSGPEALNGKTKGLVGTEGQEKESRDGGGISSLNRSIKTQKKSAGEEKRKKSLSGWGGKGCGKRAPFRRGSNVRERCWEKKAKPDNSAEQDASRTQ